LIELRLVDQVCVGFDVRIAAFAQVLVQHVFVFARNTHPVEGAERETLRRPRRIGPHIQKRGNLIGLGPPGCVDRE